MKTITSILIAFIAIILISCDVAYDETKCFESVKKTFPNSKIFQEPGQKYIYYVIDSIGVRKVTTGNISNANIDGVIEFTQIE